MSESKTPTPEPVGFYCDHSDEEPGKRTHEGWEWKDEERAWTHQPTIVSSHAGPHEWDMDRRLCPRAVPVYAVDVPALLAERDRARADAKSWHDTYQQSAGAVDEFFAVLLGMLPGAADEGADAYDQIPRGIDKLKDEAGRLRTEQAAVFAALRDALGTSPATLGQAATQTITALQHARAERAEYRDANNRMQELIVRRANERDRAMSRQRNAKAERDAACTQMTGMVRILSGLLKHADLSDDVRIEIENALDGTEADR